MVAKDIPSHEELIDLTPIGWYLTGLLAGETNDKSKNCAQAQVTR
jgi:hypothetical protein